MRKLESVFKSEAGTDWFSIPVFFVLLRETIEVMVILACLFSALDKLNLQSQNKWITYGAFAGVAVDVVIGVALIITFVTLKDNAFDPNSPNEIIFEGTLMLFASGVVTVFALGLTKFICELQAKLEAKMSKFALSIEQSVVSKEHDDNKLPTDSLEITTDEILVNPGLKWNLGIMAFVAVVREGLECVVFLAGLTSSYSGNSMIFPAFAGVIIGLLLGYLLIFSSKRFTMLWFVIVSMIMLFMIGGGLLTRAFTEFIEIGLEGGPEVFNAKECCNQNVPFWGFMRIIFGYNDSPSLVEFLVYFGYWIIVISVCYYKGITQAISSQLAEYQVVMSDPYMDAIRSKKISASDNEGKFDLDLLTA